MAKYFVYFPILHLNYRKSERGHEHFYHTSITALKMLHYI